MIHDVMVYNNSKLAEHSNRWFSAIMVDNHYNVIC